MGIRHRLVAAAFGVFLLGVGVYALVFADAPAIARLVGGLALIALGGNLVWSAWRARESWLARLGPLP